MKYLVAKKSFFRPGPTSRPRLFALGLLVVVLSSLGLTVSAHAAAATAAALELYVHELVNEHRTTLGLTPLALIPEISDIARVHSRDMATGRVARGHAGADARAEKISNSIPYRGFGENVAAINQGGEGGEGAAAVSGWLQSPGHRRNIEGSYDLAGIGIARSEDGTYFFTQLFVTPATHSSPVPLPTPEPAHSTEAQPPPAEVDAAPSLFAQLAWALLGLAWELWGFAVDLYDLAWDLLFGLAGALFAPAPPRASSPRSCGRSPGRHAGRRSSPSPGTSSLDRRAPNPDRGRSAAAFRRPGLTRPPAHPGRRSEGPPDLREPPGV